MSKSQEALREGGSGSTSTSARGPRPALPQPHSAEATVLGRGRDHLRIEKNTSREIRLHLQLTGSCMHTVGGPQLGPYRPFLKRADGLGSPVT